MPELPDITVYIEALERRILQQPIERVLLQNPFLLRTAEPPLSACEGQRVLSIQRLGKRIAIGTEGDLWLVLHLMIAGRLHWFDATSTARAKPSLLSISFPNGRLTLTEAGTKRRASLHVTTTAQLNQFDRGGLELLDATEDAFRIRMSERNHTLKRALTDPGILSGIGNAYSDEILHHAMLSPLLQTKQLTPDQWTTLFQSCQSVLREWIARLREQVGEGFPEKVTAFHPNMAVHGKYGEPCPRCGTTIQRIRYADNETNYCPRCQTGGKVLADRSLSRLLKDDWPRTIEELERGRVTGNG
jgi:formamidopyrimidine-DNA glycosylase